MRIALAAFWRGNRKWTLRRRCFDQLASLYLIWNIMMKCIHRSIIVAHRSIKMPIFAAAFIFVALFSSHAMAQARVEVPIQIDASNLRQASDGLTEWTRSDNAEDSVSGWVGLAQIDLAKGDLQNAIEHLKRANEKLAELPMNSGWGVVVDWMQSRVALAQGDKEAARNAIRSAKSRVESGAPTHLAWIGAIEHSLSLATDDNSRARKASEAAVAAFTEAKMYADLGVATMRLGDLEYDRNKKRRAFKDYDDALRAFRHDENSKEHIVRAQLHIAEQLFKNGELKAAQSRIDLAESELSAIGNPPELVAELNRVKSEIVQ